MKKKCYYVNFEDDVTRAAVQRIVEMFPCFVWEENMNELWIECREEDLASIERILAPVV